VQVVLLLLQRARHVLNLLLLFLQVHIHLLGVGAHSGVFIPSDVILNLQVTVHVLNFFPLNLLKDGCLVGLHDIVLLLSCKLSVVYSALVRGLGYGQVAA